MKIFFLLLLLGVFSLSLPGEGLVPLNDWCDFSDSRAALAIANSGTPGCHAAGENITFSLLRSGTAVEDGPACNFLPRGDQNFLCGNISTVLKR